MSYWNYKSNDDYDNDELTLDDVYEDEPEIDDDDDERERCQRCFGVGCNHCLMLQR